MPLRRSSRKRKHDDEQNESDAMSAAKPSSVAMLNVEAFVSNFDDAKPKKALDAWKRQMETKEKLIDELRTLTKPREYLDRYQQGEDVRGELLRQLDPERRADLFQSLDIEIDWSHIDTKLNEGSDNWGPDWA